MYNINMGRNKINEESVRCSFHINDDMYSEIKKRALNKRVTVKKWLTIAIVEQLKKEQSYD